VSETPEERREAAKIRRRWITLGELLAIAAVVISALTLWNSYKERANSEAERSAESHKAEARAHVLLLKASVAHGGDSLGLAPLDGDQVIQSQTIAFPAALGLSPVETTGDARIEAGWFADALKKARGKNGRTSGDLRLPIAVTTRYVAGDAPLTDIALYAIGYGLEGRFLGGDAIRLKGLSLLRRVDAKHAQKALDAAWVSAR
jgi:hypothetical protein